MQIPLQSQNNAIFICQNKDSKLNGLGDLFIGLCYNEIDHRKSKLLVQYKWCNINLIGYRELRSLMPQGLDKMVKRKIPVSFKRMVGIKQFVLFLIDDFVLASLGLVMVGTTVGMISIYVYVYR